MLVFILFVLGLIHTSNFSYAFQDLKIKLPFLVIPFLAFAFFPFTIKEFKFIFHSVFAGVIFSMAFGILIYLGWINWQVNDMRNYSPFISNVRFGTLLVFCMICCGYFMFKKEYLFAHRFFYLLFAFTCLAFLMFIQSLTGIVALVGTLLILAVYGLVKKQNRKLSFFLLFVFLLVGGCVSGLIWKEYHRIHDIEKIEVDKLPKATYHGSMYRHNTKSTETVNGHYVWINICYWELKREWNKRSKIDFDGKTNKGWPLEHTLIKYLTSKGLKKNAEAIQSLTDKEVKAIENGAVNFLSIHPLDIRWRINQFLVELEEYKKDGDPNGRSFATRLETWQIALVGISQQKIFGYGTGDVRDIMKSKYAATGSKLEKKHWLNPHQQYFTVALAVGLIGLVVFVGLLFYPLIRFRELHILFITMISIAGIAMLDEDTLETQAGCTQFVFLYVLTWLLHKRGNTKAT